MFSITLSDSAWMHAFVALVAYHQNLSIGTVDGMSPEFLFNRGQALRMIKQRIYEPVGMIKNAPIGTIASLLNIEVS